VVVVVVVVVVVRVRVIKLHARPGTRLAICDRRRALLFALLRRVGRGMGGSEWQTVKGTQKARKMRGPLARGETMSLKHAPRAFSLDRTHVYTSLIWWRW
jgi:hypothetical protein